MFFQKSRRVGGHFAPSRTCSPSAKGRKMVACDRRRGRDLHMRRPTWPSTCWKLPTPPSPGPSRSGTRPTCWSGSSRCSTRAADASDSCFYAFGDYDLVLIADFSSPEGAAAFSLAATAGGAVKTLKTTPLLTIEQGTRRHGSRRRGGQAVHPAGRRPGPPRVGRSRRPAQATVTTICWMPLEPSGNGVARAAVCSSSSPLTARTASVCWPFSAVQGRYHWRQ